MQINKKISDNIFIPDKINNEDERKNTAPFNSRRRIAIYRDKKKKAYKYLL